MKNPVILVVAVFLSVSCQVHHAPSGKTGIPAESSTDQLVRASVTNADGIKLDMIYNNSRHTATFRRNGQTIELKQDTTASGIKYSNREYEYREWHGEMTLKKDGKIIFVNKSTKGSRPE